MHGEIPTNCARFLYIITSTGSVSNFLFPPVFLTHPLAPSLFFSFFFFLTGVFF